jgi:phage tail tape-measure protein
MNSSLFLLTENFRNNGEFMSDEMSNDNQIIELTEQEINTLAGGIENTQYVAKQLSLVPDDLTKSVSQSVDKIFSAIPLLGLNL